MTTNQTAQLMDTLAAAYPQFYSGRNAPNREAALETWGKCFEDDDPFLVADAVKAIIVTSTSGFPPSIGEVKEKMLQLSCPASGMTELEAWNLVSRAAKNGLYAANEEFDKLPPILQRLVGSPSQLRDWAMLEDRELQTVVGSHFQRAYRERAKQEKDFLKYPAAIRERIAALADGMELEKLPEAKKTACLPEPRRADSEAVKDFRWTEIREIAEKAAVKLETRSERRLKAVEQKRETVMVTEDGRREALARLENYGRK